MRRDGLVRRNAADAAADDGDGVEGTSTRRCISILGTCCCGCG